MSEQKKMTILQPAEATVSAADMMGGPMQAEKVAKKRALPGKDEVWTTEQEMLALKRVAKLLEGMPPRSLRRIRGYIVEMIDECLAPDLRPLTAAYVASKAG